MREIKFRCWDATDKIMWNPLHLSEIIKGGWELESVNEEHSLPHGDYNAFVNESEVVWMQFTGLHDKNGKEIYEGDIVSTPKGICPVTFELGCFYTITTSRYRLGGWGGIIEVVGNIYETPGLIDRG